SRRRHTRLQGDWSSDVCSSDLAFQRALREFGYIEGRNLVLECRDAPGRVERFPDLALELVRLKVDVLVADGTPASLAAKQTTKKIGRASCRERVKIIASAVGLA